MDPPKLATMTIVMALVLLSHSSGSHIGHHGHGAKPKISSPPATSDQKVNLSVYYDSLSKPSATFIIRNLDPIFNNGLINIVNLQLVPWANAHINSTNNGSISCQNGPDECELNSLEACGLKIYNTTDKQYAWIQCMEFRAFDRIINCSKILGLSKKPVLNCFERGNGIELGKKSINEIAQLKPPPSFVPWVVVNNQPIQQDYENFTHYVCKAYQGADVPEVCKSKFNYSGVKGS